MTHRDAQLARRVAWARKEGLHQSAIDLAGKYLNYDEPMLRLISKYNAASEMDRDGGRDEAMKRAFDAIIQYIRTIPIAKEAA
jgi:hypothetical protein